MVCRRVGEIALGADAGVSVVQPVLSLACGLWAPRPTRTVARHAVGLFGELGSILEPRRAAVKRTERRTHLGRACFVTALALAD